MPSRPAIERPATARSVTLASRPTTHAGGQQPVGFHHAAPSGSHIGSGRFHVHEAGTTTEAGYRAGHPQWADQAAEQKENIADGDGVAEDDDEEEDDDEDVFAFAPPGSSQGVVTVPNFTGDWRHHCDAAQGMVRNRFSPDTATLAAKSSVGDIQKLYYDDSYGAVYDADGRMVKAPEHTLLHSDQLNRGEGGKGHPSWDWEFKRSKRHLSSQGGTIDISVDVQPRADGQPGIIRAAPFFLDSSTGGWEGQVELHSAAVDSSELLKAAASQTNGSRAVELELEEEEDSPYPEVRASVSNVDDPSMPTVTFRSIFLGILLSCLISATNTLLAMRNPPVQITAVIVQLLAHPLGKLLAAALPYRTFQGPSWLGGYSFSFNPGLWNIKEHTVVNIITSNSVNMPYPLPLLLTQDLPRIWNEPQSFLFALLFICAPQLMGLTLSGFVQDILIRPASMIWPQNLATTTILNTLHAEDEPEDGSMRRIKFFAIVSATAFFFYFFPGFLFQALSLFNWVCWIWPDNVPVNTVFGVAGGLGASVITFDWTQIQFVSNPLINPWWAQLNLFGGFVLGLWIFAPALYFTNTWYTGHLPIISGATYDRHGDVYDVQRVTLDHRSLDRGAYEAYSPIYMSAGLVVTYTTGFAILTGSIVHTALHHGKSLWWSARLGRIEEEDVHNKLMRRYRQVPRWWSAVLFIVAFVLCIILVAGFETGLPIWALFLSILVPVFYLIPFGMIYAMTSLSLTVNLMAELVASYVTPHHTMAIMTFKAISQHTMNSVLSLTQDQKLGHYMKLAPREVFCVQILAILVSTLVQSLTKVWMVRHIPGLCSPDQKDSFSCTSVGVWYSASIVWGAIGPQRTFGQGSIYHPLYYGLLVGAIAPVVVWWLAKRFPRSWLRFRFMSTPIIFAGMQYAPPAQGINFTSSFAVGVMFQYVLRKRAFAWWTRYNFVAAGALDFGTMLSLLLIFFALQLPKDDRLAVNWWGNEVFTKTADYQGQPLYAAPPEGFGPLPKF